MSARPSISVSKACGERVFAYTAKSGMSASAFVEALVRPVLAGEIPIPAECLPTSRMPRPRPAQVTPAAEEVTSSEERAAYIRGVLESMAAVTPGAGLSTTVLFPVSAILHDTIDAVIARGRGATPSQVLEDGINRMLDVLERTPRSNFCAVCTGQIAGDARLLPLGPGDAMVWVCYACDEEHPRKGRYSFAGGRSADPTTTAGVRSSGRDGNGNQHARLK